MFIPLPQVDAGELLVQGFQSFSMESFEELVDLAVGMMRADGVHEPPRGYNSEHLKCFQAEKRIHFPQLYKAKFSLLTPDYVITYM